VGGEDPVGAMANLHQLVKPEEGQVSRLIFTDPEIYQLELERIFAKCWLYLAHETEIPNRGDFVTRSMGEDPVIVVRGEDDEVRVLLNTCRHRGRSVCREDMGNADQFRCPYHGWTYGNTGKLIGIPAYKQIYPQDLGMAQLGLYEAPQVDSYRGLIFATWDDQAQSLSDYLGGMKWYLDLLVGRTDSGVEDIGPPQRWIVEANWKLGAGNFVGDAYHVYTTHEYRVALGGLRVTSQGYQVHTDNGHGLGLTHPDPDTPFEPYFALPKEFWPEFERNLTQGQLEVMRPLRNAHGTVFPNLSFLHPAAKRSKDDPVIAFFTLHQWQPKGPNKIEIWSWCLVEKKMTPEQKEASRRHCIQNFGMAGTTEQDDMETWADITQASSGPKARRLDFHFGMGFNMEPVRNWPGPGVAYSTAWTEANERALYQRWLDLMTTP